MPDHSPNCQCVACKAKRGETKGANSFNFGRHHSEETKKKIKKGNLGKLVSKETCEKQRIAHQGAKRKSPHKSGCRSVGCRAARGDNPFQGHHHTSISKQKIGDASRTRPPEVYKKNSVAHKLLWKDPEYVKISSSISDTKL